MRKRLLATGIMTTAFSASVFSVGFTPMDDSLVKSFEKEFFGGYGVSQANHNQSVLLNSASDLTNHYKSDSYNAGSYLLGLGVSKHYKTLDNGSKVYFGVEASYLHNDNLNGDISPATNLAPNKYLSKSYLVFCPDCFQNVI